MNNRHQQMLGILSIWLLAAEGCLRPVSASDTGKAQERDMNPYIYGTKFLNISKIEADMVEGRVTPEHALAVLRLLVDPYGAYIIEERPKPPKEVDADEDDEAGA